MKPSRMTQNVFRVVRPTAPLPMRPRGLPFAAVRGPVSRENCETGPERVGL